MINFQRKLSKLIEQVYCFIKMYGVKGKLSRTSFKGMASFFFFGFCNTFFWRHLQWTSKKLAHEQIQELLNFSRKLSKLIDQMHLFMKMYGIKGQLCKSSFTELASLFWFCNVFFCICRVIYLNDLYTRFIKTKITKLNKQKLRKNVIILFRNHLAGPVNLVKLAWPSRSKYLFENYLFAFYNQPGQISVKRFFQMIISSCLCMPA